MTLNASIQRTCNGVSMKVHRLPGLAIFWTQELSFGQLLPITLDPHWRSISQYIDAPSQEVRHEIQSREINQPSNMENPDSFTNHGHNPCCRFYACTSTRRRTWRWPLGRRQRTSWRQRAWRVTASSIARDHFTNQNPCVATDKISENCPQLGEKPWQTIPEKTQNRFESRFE